MLGLCNPCFPMIFYSSHIQNIFCWSPLRDPAFIKLIVQQTKSYSSKWLKLSITTILQSIISEKILKSRGSDWAIHMYFPPLFLIHYITSLTLKPGPPIVASITAMLNHKSLRYWNWPPSQAKSAILNHKALRVCYHH